MAPEAKALGRLWDDRRGYNRSHMVVSPVGCPLGQPPLSAGFLPIGSQKETLSEDNVLTSVQRRASERRVEACS